MDPETKCANPKCGHERKWHDPCTPCELKIRQSDRCRGFVEPEPEVATDG